MKSFLLLLFCFLNAQAQPIQSASPEELADRLASQTVATRSLRNLVPAPRNIDLIINFDIGSSVMHESSKALVKNLATAMNSDRVKEVKFRVEGHTDAVGNPQSNKVLSEKRAKSVVDLLVVEGVDQSRLISEGMGQTQLLLPDQPRARENRRVRISSVD